MPPSHLVANGKLTLDGNIDFDHLDDPRQQVVAAFQLFDFVLENGFNKLFPLLQLEDNLPDFILDFIGLDERNFVPTPERDTVEHLGGNFLA